MNRLYRALAVLSLAGAFSPAAFAQAPETPLPDAPLPQLPAKQQPPATLPDPRWPRITPPPAGKGFIARAADFFNRRAIVNDPGHMYDFGFQQKLFGTQGLAVSLEGGTLDGNYGNVELNAGRDSLRAVMGIPRDEPCALCTTLYPSNNDNRHGNGFAVGIRLTFGR